MTQNKKITVALAGNPNSGKSTVFNMLTGARQHVGNYPGVTVEKREGVCRYKDTRIDIIDLPGTYSLTAHSTEELVARDYLIDNPPDIVVHVIDASNLERNLFLATQLMELDIKLVLMFNMTDVAESKGLVFDIEQLSLLLEAPIVSGVGSKGIGKTELLDAIIEKADQPFTPRKSKVSYGIDIEKHIAALKEQLDNSFPELNEKYPSRWLALKLLEHDEQIWGLIGDEKIKAQADQSAAAIKKMFGDEADTIIADRRYGFVSGACQETIRTTVEARHDFSDKIDEIVTHRVLGIPIFLTMMFMVFTLTFLLGHYPMEWLEYFFGWSASAIASVWPAETLAPLRSLIIDGMIGGVGEVLVFLPNIILLFAAIAVLEGSGYMARAAFVVDRFMHKIGLHGKSFVPMLIGFGCSIPAIMGTRILENRRNRFTTIMVIPLMSCAARYTIYALIIPAFFSPLWRGPMFFIIYLIGIILAIISAKLLRSTLFKGETTPFVMELPPYRWVTMKAVTMHMWRMGWLYLKKAGTIILLASIIIWFASTYPSAPAEAVEGLSEHQAAQVDIQYSVMGRLGSFIEPAIKPLGFDWRIGTALIGASAAKEVFVSQLGVVFAIGDDTEEGTALREVLQSNYSALTAFCIMIFCLITAPCVATIAVVKQETNSWFWAIFQYAGLTVMAYVVTLVVYQTGSLFI